MSQHGAARPSDESDGRGAARGDASPAPSRDERPRPQYGEYAPEGWSWQPPADERTSDPAPQMATPPPLPVAASVDRRDRPADRIVTILLLVVGVLGAWSAIGSLQSLPTVLPEALRQASEMLGTGGAAFDYTPAPEVAGLILTGQIIQFVLLAFVVWWSIARLRARRLAFWVPLVGGVLSFIALYAIMFAIIMSDPALVERLSAA
ncbi:DUF6264 family protein [Agromyces albus]|uniref:DUF6264 family protein n=1 Tax=Agromyces albus TaxID=205332 RepID=UPI00278781ED|nr:DUF6264 family protein [Agromyces albus]MDQ0576006.1 hypothetical protein [Agromyces albus]